MHPQTPARGKSLWIPFTPKPPQEVFISEIDNSAHPQTPSPDYIGVPLFQQSRKANPISLDYHPSGGPLNLNSRIKLSA
jgi:hypothetical protein